MVHFSLLIHNCVMYLINGPIFQYKLKGFVILFNGPIIDIKLLKGFLYKLALRLPISCDHDIRKYYTEKTNITIICILVYTEHKCSDRSAEV